MKQVVQTNLITLHNSIRIYAELGIC
uniref:Uncharacterized protein n=1 Tax=Tetranychus urticae TaxID=32264 RepID=T1KU97_TETUR